jgi:hypothetical protein
MGMSVQFRRNAAWTATCIGLCSVAMAAHAQEEGIVTDRPDFVESSQVVGKGRFQIETSVAFDRDNHGPTRERTMTTPTLLRFGVGETIELRVETDGRSIDRSTPLAGGTASTSAGYADTALGIKWHVLDDVGNLPSVALLLHGDMPSGSRALRGSGVRPSLRVTAEWDLPSGMSLGVMPGVAMDRGGHGSYRYGILGVVLGKAIDERLRGFIEVASPHIAHGADGGTSATFDVGAAYLVSNRCQVDTMFSRGLNRRTPDLSWTVGLSFKL